MAWDLSKIKIFSKLDARARILVLLGSVVLVAVVIYLAVRFFTGGGETTGPSRVAQAPAGLQSVPGGELTPEYYRVLSQANVQAAQKAQITGGSAVPTLINIGQQQAAPQQTGTCIVCTDDSINVKTYLDDWVRQGKISPDVSAALSQLASKNVSVDEYAAALDQMVKDGKLTPEQARQLLEVYKKQRANAAVQQSAQIMDPMIKSGQLPLGVANQLLAAQKANVSPSEYAAMLQDLVRQGKISPATAQQLLAQYTQQRAKDAQAENLATIQQMAKSGEITSDMAKQLGDLVNQNASVDTYSKALDKAVADGKLTPAAAKKLLDAYKTQKESVGPIGTVNELLRAAENAAYSELDTLLKAGKITQEVATQLAQLIQQDVPLEAQQAVVSQLVQQNKLTPDIAKLKIADYQKVKQLRSAVASLGALQGNNAPAAAYADALKQAVQSGAITPEQAAQLMQEYQAILGRAPTGQQLPGATEAFTALQQRVQEGAVTPTEQLTGEFAAAQAAAATETAAERQARLDALANQMSSQAQELISAWEPPIMQNRTGTTTDVKEGDKTKSARESQTTSGKAGLGEKGSAAATIKAGTILFAVLDTAVNSDYPDSPVMASIVEGPYKGARLLGSLVTTKGVTGQLDRVMLNFTLMSMEAWPSSVSVSAYAVDPDKARTSIATGVDYHYMQRFGAMMATSFLQGYGSAVMSSGGQISTTLTGTNQTNPALSPNQKVAVALGQMGQALGSATQNYVNRPPTVRVDSGVGIGILFMTDTTI